MKLRMFLIALWATGFAISRSAEGQAPNDSADQGAAYLLTVRVGQPEYKIGTSVWVELTVKNVSGRNIEAPPPAQADTRCIIDVRDEKGNLAPETELGRARRAGETLYVGSTSLGLGEHEYLRPEETRSDRILLNRYYDLNRPGRYTLRVQRRDSAAGVKSNTLTITLAK